MERRDRKAQILNILAKNVRRIVERDVPDVSGLQEIRLRTGQPLRVLRGNRETVLPEEGQPHIVTKEEMRETMEYISHYSLYAYENELRQGFLTVEGGHRVGVAGKVIMEKDKVKNIQYISSVNKISSTYHPSISASPMRCSGARTDSSLISQRICRYAIL